MKRTLIAALVAALALPLASCDLLHRGGGKTAFNADSAMHYVHDQLAFGPRVPGTLGHSRTGDWLVQQMKKRADTVIEQRWNHVTSKGDTLPLRNILARFRPAATDRVLYVTHWDTRPVAEMDPDPANRNKPILGANDGASGPAMFLALGDVLKKTPPTVGVDLLFVDGEDYGDFSGDYHDVLLGSNYFAKHLPSPDYKPLFGVLWDMIADKDQEFPEEPNSVQRAPEVVTRVWNLAADLGYSNVFVNRPGVGITDDHIPLLDAGLHVIDVIDYYYPNETAQTYHHTLEDTLDKLSAHSFQVVGDVATALVTSH